MIPSKLITKENAKKRLEDRGENFMAIFVSGVEHNLFFSGQNKN